MSCCIEVFSVAAISFSLAAVDRGMKKVMLVSVSASLPRGLVRKCLTFRFLTIVPCYDRLSAGFLRLAPVLP
jgi:hypothetical protein